MARGSPACSSPASAWFRATAISGAGTALPPTPMRRPARRAASPQRSRLSDIDGEIVIARTTLEDKRKAAEAAQSDLTAAGAAEAAAREHWRAAQREADSARELHAMAEREMARNTARISALTEAKTRLIAGRDEAQGRQPTSPRAALAELPPSADLERQLADIRSEIEGKRAQLAEVRAEAQALAREAELADRRLNAIGTDRQAWSDRRDRAVAQIATLDTRSAEAKQRARVARRRAGDLRGEAPRC